MWHTVACRNHRRAAAIPAAARTPRAGAAVIWAPCGGRVSHLLHTENPSSQRGHTSALLDDVECAAWLDTKVVDPTVVSKVEEPLVRVETTGEVTPVGGAELAPELEPELTDVEAPPPEA